MALFFISAGQAAQTENHGLHAVPAPGGTAPRIDGDLSDWDLSGEIFCTYDAQTLRDIYSAKVSAMYDAARIYIAVRWRDPAPLGNGHDPRYQAARGWAGDCVQLRFKTDRICHVTAWYYAPRNEPAMTIAYGKNMKEAFGGGEIQLFQESGAKMQRGVEMAFKKDADGQGYVQEMAIPWDLLTINKKHTAGGHFNMGVELLWGEGDWPAHRYADNLAPGVTSREFFWSSPDNWGPVYLEAKGNIKLPPQIYTTDEAPDAEASAAPPPVRIAYDIPRDGRVTFAIDDLQGRRVRNLVAASPRKQGRNVEYWDGLDDNGRPAPPGDYLFKGIIHDGIHAKYALSFANPGQPSWPTGDGRGAFYADHTAPQAVAAAPDKEIVALACPVGESGNHLIACDLGGRRLWGLNNRAAFDGGRISLATDGVTLWVGSEGKRSSIYRVELATGRYSPWDNVQKDSSGNDYKVLDLEVSALPGMADKTHPGANLTAIAISPKTRALAAAFARENSVRIYNSDTGALLSHIEVPAPRGLAFAPSGALVVLSENRLLVCDNPLARGGGATLREFASDSKDTPDNVRALAADRAGNIFVSQRGVSQNVRVYSPGGVMLREIGARGGRPANGPFKARAMRNPGGLAVDMRGRLWVAEETMNPKRVSVWDAATGKFSADYNGATRYAAAGALNPFDITMGFSDDTVYRLDWKNNTYAPVYSLAPRDDPNDIFPPSVHNLTSRVVKKDNLLYVYTTDNARGSVEIQCTLFDGSTWRPVAHVGVVRPGDKKGAFAKYQHPFFAGRENQMYAWADENGDGLVQQNELRFATLQIDGKPVDLRSYYWGQLPGPDGTITYLVKARQLLLQFPIAAVNKAGAPVYNMEHPKIIRPAREIIGKGGSGEGMIIGGAGGRVYLNQDPLVSIDPNGAILGEYPNQYVSVHGSHHAPAARPGLVIGPSSIIGTAQAGDAQKGGAGEVFCLNGNLGENYLFTQDCLYIQTLFRDTRGMSFAPVTAVRGMPMDNITAGGESFGGNFVRAENGTFYLTLGSTDARVLEITGLDGIRRFDGKFSYSKNEYAEAQAFNSRKRAAAQQQKTYSVARAPAPPVVDGKLDEWPDLADGASARVAEIQESAKRRFARVQARHDGENLYVAFRVFSYRNAMKNTGQDEHLLFKTGDAVDVMLVREDAKAGAGALRLLMSTKDRRLIAVLNQKKAPGAAASEKYDFSSPWRTITFERVVVAPDVRLASAPSKGGFAVEAAIPWRVLGITPAPGLRLKGDFGVLLGDSASVTTSRRYWSNKSTNLVNDIPGEAELTPALWGTLVLE